MQKETSNIQLKSNLMLKSKIHGGIGWVSYAPADLLIKLHPEFRDSRAEIFLTNEQRKQKERILFLAKRIIDIE